jgi:phage N-6-adenine-methyltransferase
MDEPKKPSVHHTSKSGDWITPQSFVDDLPFDFDLDVCATAENSKCDAYLDEETDALTVPWKGVCYCNPPYGREIGLWANKAAQEGRHGATVVCLLPARPDTKWFQTIWDEASVICFIRGRVKFEKAGVEKSDPAPFPSVLVVFGSCGDSGTLFSERDTAIELAKLGNVIVAGSNNIYLWREER